MRDNKKTRAKWNRRIEELANVGRTQRLTLIRRQEIYRSSAESIGRVEIEFIYHARLECVSKLDGRRIRGKPDNGNSREQLSACLLDNLSRRSRIYRWRLARYRRILHSYFILSANDRSGDGCCQWQHLVKGREEGEDSSGTLKRREARRGGRRKKVKGRKKWRGREEKDGDEVTGGCKRSTGHRRRTTIQPHHP